MKIKILGTRAYVEASKPYHSRHSGVLIDETLLMDVGEREFLDEPHKAIFFSHFHPDHAWFVKEKVNAKVSVPVYGPEDTEYLDQVEVTDKPVSLQGYKITPFPTLHSHKVKSQAYLVEKGHKRVLYTADLIWINKEYHDQLQNLNLVITEASTNRKKGLIRRDQNSGKIFGHSGVPRLISLFKRFTSRILFVHQGTWLLKNVAEGRQKIKDHQTDDLWLEVAYDGQKIEI